MCPFLKRAQLGDEWLRRDRAGQAAGARCVSPDHLVVGSQADNIGDAVSKLRHAFGERNGGAKLTEQQVRLIRRDLRSISEIARDYDVSWTAINNIRARKTWKLIE